MQLANSLRGCWNVLDVVKGIISTWSWQFLGADGGLLLLCLFGTRNGPSLIVCNPILKAGKVIPMPLDWFHYSVHVVMFTDTVSLEYKILVIHPHYQTNYMDPMEYHYQTNYMDVYESKTSTWKRVVNTSVDPSPPWRLCKRSKFVKFKNAMYQLHCGHKTDEDWKPYLIKFDKKTGVGSILNFPELFLGRMDCTFAHTMELVVSLGRLFCMYRLHKQHDDCLEVFEVFPKRHKWESLVSMPKALLYWLHSNLEEEGPGIVDPIGCASFILFCSSMVGRFVTYDLASKTWHQFSTSCPYPSTSNQFCTFHAPTLALACALLSDVWKESTSLEVRNWSCSLLNCSKECQVCCCSSWDLGTWNLERCFQPELCRCSLWLCQEDMFMESCELLTLSPSP